MATISQATPDIDSLSATQVRLLLDTIAEHKSHLDLAHHDAMRVVRTRARPAYLLDFDLLYMFMFEYEEHVHWAEEFEYLLSSTTTQTSLVPVHNSSSCGFESVVAPGE